MDEATREPHGHDAQRKHPFFQLNAEELELALRLVLASGSLKELARDYRVSYPTIRARLDRLIERLRRIIDGMPVDSMNELLADLVERGEMTVSAAHSVKGLLEKRVKEGE